MLILTVKTGGGHISIAEALRDQLQDDYAITIADPCPGIVDGHYRFISCHALWLCALEFKLTNTPARAALVHSMLNLYLARALQHEVQVILATGRNQALLKYFTGRKYVCALPFTPEIAPYMAAADVIMGKAGANVIFESMTLGKPFIATSYIPAQEKANLEFIQRYGLGWVALEPEKLRKLIAMLATRSTELIPVSEKIQAYRQWNRAANESIGAVLHTLMPVERFA